MDRDIGIGLITGVVIGSSMYIWNSENFTKPQKIFLLICIIFPPAQWVLMILMYFINKTNLMGKLSFSKTLGSTTQLKNKLSFYEQKQSLQILKDRNVLTESEFQEKINKIDEQVITEKIYQSTEYQNLNDIYENELLTKEQFEKKTNQLIANYKEYYSIFGENVYPEFNWELYNLMKFNNKINTSDYLKSDLYGKWKYQSGQIFLYREKEINKDKLKLTWTKGLNRYGSWSFKDEKINIELEKSFGHEKVTLEIVELGSHILVYMLNGKKYTCFKDITENKNVW